MMSDIDYLQINHVSGKRHFWIFSSVNSWDNCFLDFLLHKPCSEERIQVISDTVKFFISLETK